MSCQLRKMKAMAQSGCQEKCVDSQANREFQDRLAKMQAERAKQDTMWDTNYTTTNDTGNTVKPNEQTSLGVKSYTQTAYSVYNNISHQ